MVPETDNLLKCWKFSKILFLKCFKFLAVLGLCCCASFSLVAANRGCSLVVVPGLALAVASLLEHRLQSTRASVIAARSLRSCGSRALEHRLNSCDPWASLLCGLWDHLVWRMEPVCPALAGEFFTTEPPRKAQKTLDKGICSECLKCKRSFRKSCSR